MPQRGIETAFRIRQSLSLHNFFHHKDCPGDSKTRPSAGSKRNLPVRFSQNANELTRSLYDLNWWGLQRQCCEPTNGNEAKDYRS